MSLLEPRLEYGPFEYEWAYEYFLKQHLSHWIHLEVQMSKDENDWNQNRLTEAEKTVIGRTLKGFVQAEVLIQNYWSTHIPKWFKKPEIQLAAAAFAAFEGIHQAAYANLQETLNIRDYKAFLSEPAAKAKIDRLLGLKGKSKHDIALGLAVFSAFNEGVNLFSSFAILMSFSLRNLLMGTSQLIQWSIRDESLHSKFGCQLFRQLITEYPDVMTKELKEEIYDAARLTVKLEDDFINQAFELGTIESINPEDLKAYIRFRTNTKLKDLTLQPIYKNLDKSKLDNFKWFSVMSAGLESQDFFANNVTSYTKSITDFSSVWNKYESRRSEEIERSPSVA